MATENTKKGSQHDYILGMDYFPHQPDSLEMIYNLAKPRPIDDNAIQCFIRNTTKSMSNT